jgi:hypothetical protein
MMVTVGFGVRTHLRAKQNRETIAIAEELLERIDLRISFTPTPPRRTSLRFLKARVTYPARNKRTVHGVLELSRMSHDAYTPDLTMEFGFAVDLERTDGSWRIVRQQPQEYETLWDRVTRYAKSFLP